MAHKTPLGLAQLDAVRTDIQENVGGGDLAAPHVHEDGCPGELTYKNYKRIPDRAQAFGEIDARRHAGKQLEIDQGRRGSVVRFSVDDERPEALEELIIEQLGVLPNSLFLFKYLGLPEFLFFNSLLNAFACAAAFTHGGFRPLKVRGFQGKATRWLGRR